MAIASTLSRWLAPVVLAAGFGVFAMAPVPAQAQSSQDIARVIVDVADVIFRSGQPYYRHGNYGHNDRLIVVRDRYGRPTYYRQVNRAYRPGPPYGVAHGYYRNGPGNTRVKCNKHGKCKVQGHYYDARYDRDRHDRRDRYSRYDRYNRYDRYDRDDRRRRDRWDD